MLPHQPSASPTATSPAFRPFDAAKVVAQRCSCRAASRRITRKYSRREMARLQRRECSRLKQMLPSLAHLPSDVGELVVIEEAIKHISVLEDAILKRIRPANKDPASPLDEELQEDISDAGFGRERSEEDLNLLRGLIYPSSFYRTAMFGAHVYENVDPRPVAASLPRKVAPKKC